MRIHQWQVNVEEFDYDDESLASLLFKLYNNLVFIIIIVVFLIDDRGLIKDCDHMVYRLLFLFLSGHFFLPQMKIVAPSLPGPWLGHTVSRAFHDFILCIEGPLQYCSLSIGKLFKIVYKIIIRATCL